MQKFDDSETAFTGLPISFPNLKQNYNHEKLMYDTQIPSVRSSVTVAYQVGLVVGTFARPETKYGFLALTVVEL